MRDAKKRLRQTLTAAKKLANEIALKNISNDVCIENVDALRDYRDAVEFSFYSAKQYKLGKNEKKLLLSV